MSHIHIDKSWDRGLQQLVMPWTSILYVVNLHSTHDFVGQMFPSSLISLLWLLHVLFSIVDINVRYKVPFFHFTQSINLFLIWFRRLIYEENWDSLMYITTSCSVNNLYLKINQRHIIQYESLLMIILYCTVQ